MLGDSSLIIQEWRCIVLSPWMCALPGPSRAPHSLCRCLSVAAALICNEGSPLGMQQSLLSALCCAPAVTGLSAALMPSTIAAWHWVAAAAPHLRVRSPPPAAHALPRLRVYIQSLALLLWLLAVTLTPQMSLDPLRALQMDVS